VAIQLIETPRIPYYPHPSVSLPESITRDANLRTSKTLTNLPPLPRSFNHVIHLLHTLATAYANMLPSHDTDAALSSPLYAAQFALLQILEKQKNTVGQASELEVLLANAFQLYFVVGPRSNPPVMCIFDLLVARLKDALVPYLGDATPHPVFGKEEYNLRTVERDVATNEAIAWSLGIGACVAAWMGRSEDSWFKGHVGAHFGALGLDRSEEEWRVVLRRFPGTEGFVWLDVWGLEMLRAECERWGGVCVEV
jgi:hypothetical protein